MFVSFDLFRVKKALLISMLLLTLAGCLAGPPPIVTIVPTPVVGMPIVSTSQPINPGEEIGVSVQVDSAEGIKLTYEWIPVEGKGKILTGEGTSAITYQAPREPGIYSIRVKITGSNVSIERSTFINVRETSQATTTPAINTQEGIDNPPSVLDAERIRNEFADKEARIEYWGGDLDPPGSWMDQRLAKQFTQDTGIKIIIRTKPRSATEAYSQLQNMFEQGNPPDVLVLDVIWVGGMASRLRELQEFTQEAQYHYSEAITNTTIEGKLVAMPWFVNLGLLYYRTDLLQKYGYTAPPKTWTELTEMAKKIQAGERVAGNPDFWGFVWQGAAYEGLTCNAMEWIASSGGGSIIEHGKVTINNENAIKALNQAKSWIGTISPVSVTSYTEEDTRKVFQSGNAAFMRNWPTVYTSLTITKSVPFDIAPLPGGDGNHSVATLGGSVIGISRSTDNAQAAVEFVRYMSSPNVQEYRARFGTFIPTIPSRSLSSSNNFQVPKAIMFLQNHETSLVERPSAETKDYFGVSKVIFQGVGEILSGKDAAQVVPQMEQELKAYVLH